jgi:acyl-CoA synthetase (AMP-forming)/AMP-acid ligase II
MTTSDRDLTGWMEESARGRGLHFAGPRNEWHFWSYERLAQLSLRVSAAYRERGLAEGNLVAIIQRSSPGFTASVFGAFSAGVTACSIAPPFAMQRSDDYVRHVAHLLGVSRPDLVVCDADSAVPVRGPLADLGLAPPVLFDELVADAEPATGPREPTGTVLLQFTSGSVGSPRGVRVSAGALKANLDATRHWLEADASQPTISWLPVHHDMGLVGCLLNIVVTGCDGYLLQPEDFIRSPLRYLTCISENRVAHAAMPNFGLAYILHRIRPDQLGELRFDCLRSVIIGAERIDSRVLRAFEELLGPHGMDYRSLLPSYGSAEATLAVTCLPPRTGWQTAVPRGAGSAIERTQSVGCGRPLRGITVTIVDENGTQVPDGQIGEITVTGPSVATEQVQAPGESSGTRFEGTTLHTGDAGFLVGGELFVIGRFGDGIKVRGQMVFAESLELALCERGVPGRRVTVLLGVCGGRPSGVVVFENEQQGWAAIAADVLGAALGDADLMAVNVPRGGIAVTSSGKPRRRLMWRAFLESGLRGAPRPLAVTGAGSRVGRDPDPAVRDQSAGELATAGHR